MIPIDPEPPRAAAVLVCLDALEPVSANAVAGAPRWRAAAAVLLAHARNQGWAVAHVLQRRPGPGKGGWRTAPGLAPLPSEPVYHREAASAFGNREFAAFVRESGIRRLVLLGCSVDSACLATTLDAVQAGLRLILPVDAVAVPARELGGLQALAAIGRRADHVRLSLSSVQQLVKAPADLRVIRGGRI